ncbi:MAG: hypothetical protein ACOX68_03580 [Candidatus Limivicinus sp.]|jgi:hypothetical protein
MDFYKELSNFYGEVLQEEAKQLIPSAAKKVIRELRGFKTDSGMMQSGSDSMLENIWDEICVQVQGERSFFWENYSELIDDICADVLKKDFTAAEIKIIGLQSDKIYCWFNIEEGESCVDDGEDCYELDEGFTINDVLLRYAVQNLVSEVLKTAYSYTNRRISRFLDEGYTI